VGGSLVSGGGFTEPEDGAGFPQQAGFGECLVAVEPVVEKTAGGDERGPGQSAGAVERDDGVDQSDGLVPAEDVDA
jgi:hypothetical protein